MRELVERYEAAGVDQMIFVMQAGRTRHEHICEAIELFGRDVLPAFAARADEIERAETKRLQHPWPRRWHGASRRARRTRHM